MGATNYSPVFCFDGQEYRFKRGPSREITQEEFDVRVHHIHGGRLDSHGAYHRVDEPIDLFCKECGTRWTVERAGVLLDPSSARIRSANTHTVYCPHCLEERKAEAHRRSSRKYYHAHKDEEAFKGRRKLVEKRSRERTKTAKEKTDD